MKLTLHPRFSPGEFLLSVILLLLLLIDASLRFPDFQNSLIALRRGERIEQAAHEWGQLDVGGIPTKLRIPALQTDARVEYVGLQHNGNMDVPAAAENAGWFKLGYRPGQRGNAVLAGHLDTPTGGHGIFWNLHTLNIGDDVYIEDVDGKMFHYRVVKSMAYDYDKSPMHDIFGPHDKRRLNLITCNGEWNEGRATYNRRLVVYTELVDDSEE